MNLNLNLNLYLNPNLNSNLQREAETERGHEPEPEFELDLEPEPESDHEPEPESEPEPEPEPEINDYPSQIETPQFVQTSGTGIIIENHLLEPRDIGGAHNYGLSGNEEDRYDHIRIHVPPEVTYTELRVTILNGPGTENGNDQELSLTDNSKSTNLLSLMLLPRVASAGIAKRN